MKSVCCLPRRRAALPIIALAALASAPHAASAQAVGAYLRPGGGNANSAPAQTQQNQPRPVQPRPVQPQPVQSYPSQRPTEPMRPGSVYERPVTPTRIDIPSNYSRGPVVSVPEEMPRPTRPIDRDRNWQPQYQPQYQQSSDPQYNPTRIVAPVGPANGFFNNSIPPIGPANGFGGTGYSNVPVRIDTPQGRQNFSRRDDDRRYIYNTVINPTPVIVNAPPLLGGYYYGNYCDTYAPTYTYPSVYSAYLGFPRYLFNPAVIVVSQPYCPVYATSYLPFSPPVYPVIYNETNYYVTNENRERDFEAGGDRAKEALRSAYPADSYQAAFADIARAWNDGDIKLLRRHVRDTDTRLSVFLDKKYSYSIASGDFLQITRDALDRLNTVSFDFTRLRKAKNGDVTAFGKHIYRVSGNVSRADDGATVPFDQNGADTSDASPYDPSADPASGEEKTVYVSYTLHHGDSKWYIIALDSSEHSLTASE